MRVPLPPPPSPSLPFAQKKILIHILKIVKKGAKNDAGRRSNLSKTFIVRPRRYYIILNLTRFRHKAKFH